MRRNGVGGVSHRPYDPSRLDPDRTVTDAAAFIIVAAAVVLLLAAIGGAVAEWL
jgi:hypothetical protein